MYILIFITLARKLILISHYQLNPLFTADLFDLALRRKTIPTIMTTDSALDIMKKLSISDALSVRNR